MKTVPVLALHYAELGIPALFLVPGSKRPACEHGVLEATSDKAELKDLFDRSWGDLVGLKPGPNYIVLDIDDKCKISKKMGVCLKQGTHGSHGSEKLLELELLYGDLPRTATVSTPSGGRHLWFKKPADLFISNSSPWAASGIDIRSDAGYVVAAGQDGYDWVIDLDEAKDLPEWIKTALPKGGQAVSTSAFNPGMHDEDDLEMLEAVKFYAQGHTPTTRYRKTDLGETDVYIGVVASHYDEGSRNLGGTIGVVGGASARFHCLSTDWMTDDGRSFTEGDKRGNASDPVYNIDELEAFVTTGHKNPNFQPALVSVNKRAAGKKSIAERFQEAILDLDGVENIEPPEFLIEDFLVRDSIAELFGDPGSGKSFVALDWALHIATGKDWLGLEIKKAEPVFYIIGEGRASFGVRSKAWQQHNGKIEGPTRSNVHLMTTPVNLVNADEVAAIIPIITKAAPAFVVIDTLARAVVGADGNSDKDMGIALDHADQIREATGACVLLVHHSGHSEKNRGRGSSSIFGALETDMKLSGTHDSLTLSLTKQKNAADDISKTLKLSLIPLEDSQESCLVVTDKEFISLNESGEKEEPKFKLLPSHKSLLECLENCDEGVGVSTGIWKKSAGLADPTFYRLIKELVDHGLVMKDMTTPSRPKYSVLTTETFDIVLPFPEAS
jgi:AAA domain-containing protein/bifunctional DNA primase/polymerase-like protein